MVLGIPHFKKPPNGYSYNKDSNIKYIMTIYDVITSSMSVKCRTTPISFTCLKVLSTSYSRI